MIRAEEGNVVAATQYRDKILVFTAYGSVYEIEYDVLTSSYRIRRIIAS